MRAMLPYLFCLIPVGLGLVFVFVFVFDRKLSLSLILVRLAILSGPQAWLFASTSKTFVTSVCEGS